MKNKWESINQVLLLLNESSISNANEFHSLLKGMNKNVEIVLLNDNKKMEGEKKMIQLSPKDFNLFGKLKNEEAQNLFNVKYDLLIAFDNLPQKLIKRLKKINATTKIGLNIHSSDDFFDIKMNTKSKRPEHLINFTKEILEKIKQE